MTDLREPQSPETRASGASPDPLHNLYRMSRTAGLGAGDYVAINNTSILALLLGLASVLSLLYPLMLVIALAAVVCGALALAQVRSSNGTQTGRGFAAIGILLGLGFGGASGGKMVIAYAHQRRDEQAIAKVVQRLSDLVAAKQYSEAYRSLFSDTFKSEFSEQDFIARFDALTSYLGPVQKIGWGERAEIDDIRATNTRRAAVSSVIHFQKSPEPASQPMLLVNTGGGEDWMIEGIMQIFEKQPPKGRNSTPDPNVPQGPTFTLPGAPGGSAPAAPATPGLPQ
jgi:hypothetical protein